LSLNAPDDGPEKNRVQ